MLSSVRALPAFVFISCAIAVACGGPAQQGSPMGPTAVTTIAGSATATAAVDESAVSAPAFRTPSEEGPIFEPPPEQPKPTPAEPAPPPPAPAPEPPATSPEPNPAPAPAPAPGPAPAPAPPPGPAPAPAPVPGAPPAPLPPAPPRDPNIPVPGPPTTHFRLKARVDPTPVPYSGRRIEIFACRDLAHTWFYTQILSTETGIPVTLTERENFFDGIHISTTKETIEIQGNSGVLRETRWCSGYDKAHTAQHRYKGKDAEGNVVVLMGPVIDLRPSPNAPPPPPAPPTAPAAPNRVGFAD